MLTMAGKTDRESALLSFHFQRSRVAARNRTEIAWSPGCVASLGPFGL